MVMSGAQGARHGEKFLRRHGHLAGRDVMGGLFGAEKSLKQAPLMRRLSLVLGCVWVVSGSWSNGAEWVRGRSSLVFTNPAARLVVDLAGGSIVEFQRVGNPINPLSWGTPLFEYLDAGETVTKRFLAFLIEVPADFGGVERVVLESGRLTVRERTQATPREISVLVEKGLEL